MAWTKPAASMVCLSVLPSARAFWWMSQTKRFRPRANTVTAKSIAGTMCMSTSQVEKNL